MGKFAIECQKCGNYVEAKAGFFAKKTVTCSCGNVINIKTNKLASRKCHHCGNQVVYDQTKGENAICPVCHKKINTLEDQQKLKKFSCAQCGVTLFAEERDEPYTCPLCGFENNIKERIAYETIKKNDAITLIKYDGSNDVLIWKYPIEDIKLGSKLIVHESQEVILFLDGEALKLLKQGAYIFGIDLIPIVNIHDGIAKNFSDNIHAEIYFVNKTVQMSIKWGTPEKVRFLDPITGTPLELGASGEMNIQVSDSRKLLTKLSGTMRGISWDDNHGFAKSLQASFRPFIANTVKTNLPFVIKNELIDILEIDEKLELISDKLKNKIVQGFDEYGLSVKQFYVNNIVLPENDPNFKRIRELHTVMLQTRIIQAETAVKTVQAQEEMQYKTTQEQNKAVIEKAHREAELQRQLTETEIIKMEAERKIILAQAEAQSKRLAGLTEAEIMAAKGYNQKDIFQNDIQKSYIDNLGNIASILTSSNRNSYIDDILNPVNLISPANPNISLNSEILFKYSNKPDNTKKSEENIISHNLWNCVCGEKNISGNFCSNCGRKKPVSDNLGWDCECGNKGITGKFCSNCGKQKHNY